MLRCTPLPSGTVDRRAAEAGADARGVDRRAGHGHDDARTVGPRLGVHDVDDLDGERADRGAADDRVAGALHAGADLRQRHDRVPGEGRRGGDQRGRDGGGEEGTEAHRRGRVVIRCCRDHPSRDERRRRRARAGARGGHRSGRSARLARGPARRAGAGRSGPDELARIRARHIAAAALERRHEPRRALAAVPRARRPARRTPAGRRGGAVVRGRPVRRAAARPGRGPARRPARPGDARAATAPAARRPPRRVRRAPPRSNPIAAAFAALRSPDPRAWLDVPAFERLLEELPDVRTGLTRVERQILEALRDGPLPPERLFVAVAEHEDPPWLGDDTVFALAADLDPLVPTPTAPTSSRPRARPSSPAPPPARRSTAGSAESTSAPASPTGPGTPTPAARSASTDAVALIRLHPLPDRVVGHPVLPARRRTSWSPRPQRRAARRAAEPRPCARLVVACLLAPSGCRSSASNSAAARRPVGTPSRSAGNDARRTVLPAAVRLERRGAVRADDAQVLEPVVIRNAVDVVEDQRERPSAPALTLAA